MKQIRIYLAGIFLSTILISCQFNGNFSFGVNGNGNVQKQDRSISQDFNRIEVSRGLDVYLTQSNITSIEVEADENLHDIIITAFEGNTLKIYADDNIASSKSQKVFVTFKDIQEIRSTSGSDVFSTGLIKSDVLKLTTTSGSDMDLEIDVDVVECKSTSGSDLRLSGFANKIFAEATSGSDIKASKLIAKNGEAHATSGADIILNTSEGLYAKASSGGDIKYYGNPEKVTKKAGVSGSVDKK